MSGNVCLVSAAEICPFDASLELAPDRVTVRLRGEVDLFTQRALSGALTDAAATGRPVVQIDMRELTFIDSTGISALLRAADAGRTGGHVVEFVRSEGPVERTLRIAGVDRLLPLAV
jgi:anti-sigma B factor antagonist